MRILIYSHRIGFRTITFIHNEINALAKDHNVLVVYNQADDKLNLRNCKTQRVRHYENYFVARVKNRLGLQSFKTDFEKTIEDFNPDLIHIHFGNIAVRVLQYIDVNNVPIFISFHGHDASRALSNATYVTRLNRLLSKKNVNPIFVSKAMRKKVSKAGVSFKDEHILYYGGNLAFFKPNRNSPPSSKITFLQVSSFVEKKGHSYTVRAFRKFLDGLMMEEKNKVCLILAGDGKLKSNVQKLVSKLNLENHVSFPGWVNREQAKELMNRANIFVHHSITDKDGDMEGIPNAIIEAMAMKLPILSTLHSGIPELVTNNVHGYLTEEKDIDELAKNFRKIMYWDYRSENRIKVMTQFEIGIHNQRLIEIYNRYLK